jgi:hypothetical protein
MISTFLLFLAKRENFAFNVSIRKSFRKIQVKIEIRFSGVKKTKI